MTIAKQSLLEAKGEAVSYFYSGPQGFFYVPTMEQGEIILSLMNVDKEDWTATKLATPPSVDALKEELSVTEQNLADCMAELHAYDCKVDALIAEAIEAHDNKNMLIKSVNMRTRAQPYLDELIAEIDGLDLHDTYVNFKDIRTILDKYRSSK